MGWEGGIFYIIFFIDIIIILFLILLLLFNFHLLKFLLYLFCVSCIEHFCMFLIVTFVFVIF